MWSRCSFDKCVKVFEHPKNTVREFCSPECKLLSKGKRGQKKVQVMIKEGKYSEKRTQELLRYMELI